MPANNPFKAALAAQQPQVGLWLSMADPYMAEVSASTGFDWLLIDGEHAPNDLKSTLGALQAVAPHAAQPVVRAVQGDTALIKQLLDIGAKTLLVPMVDTAEQARALVSATRYPPLGIRGVGSAVARASQWSARADYLDVADDEVCLLVQDNGAGFDAERKRSSGHGLGNMRARAARIGASLRVTSSPGEGARIVATVPVLQPSTV